MKGKSYLEDSLDAIFLSKTTEGHRHKLSAGMRSTLNAIFGKGDFRHIYWIDPYEKARLRVEPPLRRVSIVNPKGYQLKTDYRDHPTFVLSLPLKSPDRLLPRVRLNFEYSPYTGGLVDQYISVQYFEGGPWEELLSYNTVPLLRKLIDTFSTELLE